MRAPLSPGYLKLWQLQEPKPQLSDQFDAILIDEAQDCSPGNGRRTRRHHRPTARFGEREWSGSHPVLSPSVLSHHGRDAVAVLH